MYGPPSPDYRGSVMRRFADASGEGIIDEDPDLLALVLCVVGTKKLGRKNACYQPRRVDIIDQAYIPAPVR
jgi:hypothetical protein